MLYEDFTKLMYTEFKISMILSWTANKANTTRHLYSLDQVYEITIKEVQHE